MKLRLTARALTAEGSRAHLSGMKALIALLALAVLLAGCKSQNPAGAPVAHVKSSLKYGLGDGQTMATAVEIRTHSEPEGDRLLLDWIRANYPGFRVQQHENIEQRDRAYDVVTIVGPGNTTQRVYFDISSYYRRSDGGFPTPGS